MLTVWKFELEGNTNIEVEIPEGAEILTFATQRHKPCLWCLVNTKNRKETRRFLLAATGRSLDNEKVIDYIGTIQLEGGNLIYHLFERR